MSTLDSFLFLGVTVAFLWVLWLLLEFVFDRIEEWQDGTRLRNQIRHDLAEQDARDQLTAEDVGKPAKGKAL